MYRAATEALASALVLDEPTTSPVVSLTIFQGLAPDPFLTIHGIVLLYHFFWVINYQATPIPASKSPVIGSVMSLKFPETLIVRTAIFARFKMRSSGGGVLVPTLAKTFVANFSLNLIKSERRFLVI